MLSNIIIISLIMTNILKIKSQIKKYWLVGEERANLSAVVYLYYVVSVWRGFHFLWVL